MMKWMRHTFKGSYQCMGCHFLLLKVQSNNITHFLWSYATASKLANDIHQGDTMACVNMFMFHTMSSLWFSNATHVHPCCPFFGMTSIHVACFGYTYFHLMVKVTFVSKGTLSFFLLSSFHVFHVKYFVCCEPWLMATAMGSGRWQIRNNWEM